MPRSCRRVTPLDVALFFAFIGLGLGSWIAVNGIFQELAVISLTAPPEYNISVIESYAALIVAGANGYPVIYLVLMGALPCLRGDGARKQCVDRWALLTTMVVLGAGSCFLLAVFWNFNDSPGSVFLFFFLIFQVRQNEYQPVLKVAKLTMYPSCRLPALTA